MDYSEVKVLVVDDNNVNLYVASTVLEQFGIVADCVPNGKACIKKCSKKEYDLILMDHMMPEMDGVETYRELRNIEGFHTPVVVVTANVEPGSEELYAKEGFVQYIKKPIDRVAIEDLLSRYIGGEASQVVDLAKSDDSVADSRVTKLRECGFSSIDDIVASGMSVDSYEEILGIFNEESKDKILDCDSFAAGMNLKDYAIIVHGLKNDAAMISELELSEYSKLHEVESKAGNSDFVADNWNTLKTMWQSVIDKIDRYFE